MRRRVRFGLVALLAVVALAQLVPVRRDDPPVVSDVAAPPAVDVVLRRACYDCHSHETRWPWYAWVAPTSWLVADDVHQGRKHLDFSTWNAYPPKTRIKKLDAIADAVTEGWMPYWPYLLVHRDARLATADAELIAGWARGAAERLRAR
jgi:hypothetical protein